MSDEEFEILGLDKKELLGVGNLVGHYANNQKLKNIQGRGPACPHCGGNLAKSGVKVCMHCGRDVVWDYGRVLTPTEACDLIQARKTAEKQVQSLIAAKNFDGAIAIMESVFDRERVESLREAKHYHLKDLKRQARRQEESAREAAERKYGKSQIQKELMVEGLTVMPLLLGVFYGLYAISCWLLSLMNFEPWFWNIIPSWLHYSLILGCPILTYIMCLAESHWKKTKRAKITLEKETKAAEEASQMAARVATFDYLKKKGSKKKSVKEKADLETIDINSAEWSALAKLPGIGETHAKSIVLYRQQHGPFQSTDELLSISGIGPSKLRKILPRLNPILSPAKDESENKNGDSETQSPAKDMGYTQPTSTEAVPVAYWLKRGETIRGPLKRAAVLQAAKGKKLLSGDQIANSKDGPWQDITKEQLQQMQQGNDVEIK